MKDAMDPNFAEGLLLNSSYTSILGYRYCCSMLRARKVSSKKAFALHLKNFMKAAVTCSSFGTPFAERKQL